MGEYASYGRGRVKIGTCEDMYYLRADQAHLVAGESGSVDPSRVDDRAVIRFRFPWPDEDGIAPGAFEDYGRALWLHGVELPGVEFEHDQVQFTAAPGYLVSLPCPESDEGRVFSELFPVHRNGFRGNIGVCQQAYRAGVLAVICRCACGAVFNLPTLELAAPIVAGFRENAERDRRDARLRDGGEAETAGKFFDAIADRIEAGYRV